MPLYFMIIPHKNISELVNHFLTRRSLSFCHPSIVSRSSPMQHFPFFKTYQSSRSYLFVVTNLDKPFVSSAICKCHSSLPKSRQNKCINNQERVHVHLPRTMTKTICFTLSVILVLATFILLKISKSMVIVNEKKSILP